MNIHGYTISGNDRQVNQRASGVSSTSMIREYYAQYSSLSNIGNELIMPATINSVWTDLKLPGTALLLGCVHQPPTILNKDNTSLPGALSRI